MSRRPMVAAGALLAGALVLAPVAPAPAQVATGYRVEVSIGGPYRATVGAPITLTGKARVAGQSDTVDDLTAIGKALVQYRQEHGSLPPAALTDAAGRPLLSWRVLLLPQLGQDALYRRFDLTKAWDDPANRRLLSQMPAVFRAAGSARSVTTTAYAGVAGSKTVFRSGSADLGGGVRLAEIGDGPEMTIAVGPVGSAVKIPWTSPGDVDPFATNRFGVPAGFDGPGTGVTPMLFADSMLYNLPDVSTPDNIHSWATIATGICTPPAQAQVNLGAGWDLDGDGTFETVGEQTSWTPSRTGVTTVRFRAVGPNRVPTVRSVRITVR